MACSRSRHGQKTSAVEPLGGWSPPERCRAASSPKGRVGPAAYIYATRVGKSPTARWRAVLSVPILGLLFYACCVRRKSAGAAGQGLSCVKRRAGEPEGGSFTKRGASQARTWYPNDWIGIIFIYDNRPGLMERIDSAQSKPRFSAYTTCWDARFQPCYGSERSLAVTAGNL